MNGIRFKNYYRPKKGIIVNSSLDTHMGIQKYWIFNYFTSALFLEELSY